MGVAGRSFLPDVRIFGEFVFWKSEKKSDVVCFLGEEEAVGLLEKVKLGNSFEIGNEET